jgi:hypothetical protein
MCGSLLRLPRLGLLEDRPCVPQTGGPGDEEPSTPSSLLICNNRDKTTSACPPALMGGFDAAGRTPRVGSLKSQRQQTVKDMQVPPGG